MDSPGTTLGNSPHGISPGYSSEQRVTVELYRICWGYSPEVGSIVIQGIYSDCGAFFLTNDR